jgi:hypothetical protein
MKNLSLALLIILIAPFASKAQTDCTLDFMVEMFQGYITVGALDFPAGVELTWTVNGELYSVGEDFIEFVPGTFNQMPLVICVSYASDACPEGVEFCETLNSFGGGGGCPEQIEIISPKWDMCSWAFGLSTGGENSTVSWNFGDGSEIEDGSPWASHAYESDGDYIVSVQYSSVSCPEGVSLEIAIMVQGCSGEVECINQEQINLDVLCSEEYSPVCGCDNVTYSNICNATNYGGVTSWVDGECNGGGGDCTIELDYEFFDGYVIFEASNYPEGAVLFWTYNGEVYATGTHVIEIPEPNPFPEDGVEICVGYESQICPEGVFACEFFGMEDDCELELEGSFEGNTGYFEADGNIENAYFTWTINGDVVAEGVDFYNVINPNYPDGFLLCVSYFSDECDLVEACEFINPSGGGGCPEGIEIIFPKWDMCSWAFVLTNGEEFANVYWYFGDGTSTDVGGPWASHIYESDGDYIVSVQYYSDSCPEGVFLEVAIIVQGCSGEVECINQEQIDLDVLCTEEYAPVCGCDDVTYSNICNATNYGGVTSWVDGECETAVNNFEDAPDWNVFPVPTSDGLTVDGLPLGVWSMKLYDSQGREVLKKDIANGDFISMDRLSAGYYTIQIVGVEDSVKRVIIQR